MPYVSDAQRKFFNANRARLTAQGVDVDEWNASSRGKKLPARKRSAQTTEKASQDTVRAQALTAILGGPDGEGEKTARRSAGCAGLYGDGPGALADLCVAAITKQASVGNPVSSVLDETPCGATYTGFNPESCKMADTEFHQVTEACRPSLVKLAVDAIIRSFGGPLIHAPSPARTSATSKSAAAGMPNQPGPLADSVGMLHNGGLPNPMNVISRGLTNPVKPPASPAQNPINTYGPLSQAGTIGGGMFGQKMTETGSLKLSAWADRLVRLRRRRDPDGISTQPADILLAQRTGE